MLAVKTSCGKVLIWANKISNELKPSRKGKNNFIVLPLMLGKVTRLFLFLLIASMIIPSLMTISLEEKRNVELFSDSSNDAQEAGSFDRFI